MNKEKDKFNEEGIVNTPQYKKIWYSITKFEKYPEMAAEGVGRAFGYFSLIIFLFSVILAFGLAIKFSNILKNGIEYLDKNFSTIEYKNGELQINPTKYEVNGR